MVKEYVCCANARCPAYPGSSKKSWRFVKSSTAPDACTFCNTPFRLPAAAVNDSGGWHQRDAKGRARPAPSPAPAVEKKVVKFKDNQDPKELSDEALEAAFRKRFPNFLDTREDIAAELFPKKEKSRQELLMDGFDNVDKAQRLKDGAARTYQQMSTKYDRLCQELVDYQAKLVEQKAKLDQTTKDLDSANEELIQVQAQEVSGFAAATASQSVTAIPATPSVSISGIKQLADSYAPHAHVAAFLGSIPELQSLTQPDAAKVCQAVAQHYKGQLSIFANELRPDPPPPPPHPPHPAPDQSMGQAAVKRDREDDVEEMEVHTSQLFELGASQGSGDTAGAADNELLRQKAQAFARQALEQSASRPDAAEGQSPP